MFQNQPVISTHMCESIGFEYGFMVEKEVLPRGSAEISRLKNQAFVSTHMCRWSVFDVRLMVAKESSQRFKWIPKERFISRST